MPREPFRITNPLALGEEEEKGGTKWDLGVCLKLSVGEIHLTDI